MELMESQKCTWSYVDKHRKCFPCGCLCLHFFNSSVYISVILMWCRPHVLQNRWDKWKIYDNFLLSSFFFGLFGMNETTILFWNSLLHSRLWCLLSLSSDCLQNKFSIASKRSVLPIKSSYSIAWLHSATHSLRSDRN